MPEPDLMTPVASMPHTPSNQTPSAPGFFSQMIPETLGPKATPWKSAPTKEKRERDKGQKESSRDSSSSSSSSSSSPLKNKFLWIGLGIGAIVLVFVVLGFKDKILQKRHVETYEEDVEDTQAQAEYEEYLNKGSKLRERYGMLLARRKSILEQMSQNKDTAVKNSSQFKNMFAQHKSSFDDDISNFEEEQRLETAFMLKTDLDQKKDGMIKLGEQLGKQMQAMQNEIRQLDAELQQITQYYNQTYAATGEAAPLASTAAPVLHKQGAAQGQGQGQAKGVSWNPKGQQVQMYNPADPPNAVTQGHGGSATSRAVERAIADYRGSQDDPEAMPIAQVAAAAGSGPDFPDIFPRDGTGRALIPT